MKGIVKESARRLGSLLLVVVMLFSLLPVIETPAKAADVLPTGSLTVANAGYLSFTAANDHATTDGSVTLSGSAVTVTAKGYATGGCSSKDVESTTTVTVTNTSEGPMDVTCEAAAGTLSKTSPIRLESGEAFTFAVKSGAGASSTVTGTLTITSVELVPANYTTTFGQAVNGSYTVTYGGEARVDVRQTRLYYREISGAEREGR